MCCASPRCCSRRDRSQTASAGERSSSAATALYLARAAQGVGAAFLLAPALAIIGHAFHGEGERARAWAVWGGMMGLTMVLAPILGGIIAHELGWRWAFYVNVPICIVLA